MKSKLAQFKTRVRNRVMAMSGGAAPYWIVGIENVGFNGQRRRKAMFRHLLDALRFDTVVETGSCLGNTAAYVAGACGVRVCTVESNERFFRIAQRRLARLPNVHIELADSRAFLRKLAAEPENTKVRTFFYLDAHWENDVPLLEELLLIGEHWPEHVIMIDDFQVPGDPGYRFDAYGDKVRLDLAYIRPLVERFNWHVHFPAAPSSEETGSRCGCIVLAPPAAWSQPMQAIPSLRPWP